MGSTFDKINSIYGIIVAVLSYVFGDHWVLFVAFLALNVGDWITRWIAARINGSENSEKAWKGILKKLGYWVMVCLAFGMSAIFIEIGNTIHLDLSFTTMIGWFVLASLIINEIRSILENLVDGGFKIPSILTKGLEVVNKAIDGTAKVKEGDMDITLSIDPEQLKEKSRITLELDHSDQDD